MELQSQPLVTVYIPTYNRVELLKRAVKSVRDQTYKNLEVIIVDDCSTDGTHEYLAQLAKEDPRVRYFLKEKNSGACASRNIAIENANGEFITGLDDDDYFLEERIEYFIKNRSKGILFSPIFIKTRYGVNLRKVVQETVNYSDLKKGNIVGNQIFVKTKYLRKIGGFDVDLKAWQDYDLWFRLLKESHTFINIFVPSYVMDMSHEKKRITTSSNAYHGYNQFVNKHLNDLSDQEKKYLEFVDIKNRNDRVSFNYMIKNFNLEILIYFLKFFIKNKFPKMYHFLVKGFL